MSSLKQHIVDLVRVSYPEYVSGDAIEKFAQLKEHKASYGAREARKLAESGILIRDPHSKHARYVYNAKDYPLNLQKDFSRTVYKSQLKLW